MDEEVTIYDDASRHFGGEWPQKLPRSQAYIHTGIYLGWVVSAGLCGDDFRRQNAEAIADLESGTLSGPEFFQRIGGIFSSNMLSEEGNAFTAEYFDLEHGSYLKDYGHLLADIQITAYHVPDTHESSRRMGERISQRFDLWKKNRPK